MKLGILSAALILCSVIGQAKELILDQELRVERPMEIKIKSKKIILDPGTYPARFESRTKYGIFGERYFMDLSVKTGESVITVPFELQSNRLDHLYKQLFRLKDVSMRHEEVVSGVLTETKECVAHTFYTEENCRIVEDYGCSGIKIGNHCSGEYVPSPRIVCDSVAHTIKGKQEVTFKKTAVTSQRIIQFVNKKDGIVVATHLKPVTLTNGEKRISETPCK